jgi:hypothetical protein
MPGQFLPPEGHSDRASEVFAGLATATDDVRRMASNPMLLSLLCEHVKLGQEFPKTAFEVFARYVDYRLLRDADQVKRRYDVSVADLRATAEAVAFTMTADPAIGLTPKRSNLLAAMRRQNFGGTEASLAPVLDALEYMRLGRADTGYPAEGSDREFAFAHRRFQEYFATNVVVSDPDRIPALQLLTNGRWRETAVVLCQTGRPEAARPLQEEASRLIRSWTQDVNAGRPKADRGTPFPWPRGSLHVLSILQAGFGATVDDSVEPLRDQANELLTPGFNDGDLLDKRLALEVAGILRQPQLLELVRAGLANDSEWLNDTVFRQVGRLATINDYVASWIRRAILRMAFSKDFGGGSSSMRAFAARLPNAAEMHRVVLLASSMVWLDLGAISVGTITATIAAGSNSLAVTASAILIGLSLAFAIFWRKVYIIFSLVRLTLVWNVFLVTSEDVENFLPWALVGYAALWLPAATICARWGVGTRPVLWPWAPLVVVGVVVGWVLRAIIVLPVWASARLPALLRRIPRYRRMRSRVQSR